MTSPRSLFTEAIEDHLALKKQNAHLADSMPLARFDVGDPLERYPGGPVKAAVGSDAGADAADTTIAAGAALSVEAVVAPTPGAGVATGAADEATDTAGSEAGAQVVEAEFRRPLEPLGAMTPMLSLVEDVEEDDADTLAAVEQTSLLATPRADEGSVLRFPGGVGPREEEAPGSVTTLLPTTPVLDASAAETTGEQPVIVIDADEPLAPLGTAGPSEPRQVSTRGGVRRPSFFNLRRKRKGGDEGDKGAGWFSEAPRDFNWDD